MNAINIDTITISRDLATLIVDELYNLISIMEPYYAQNDAGADAFELIRSLEARLPYTQVKDPTNTCPLCSKKIFNGSSFRQHMRDKHQKTKITAAEIAEVISGEKVEWPTKQHYIDTIQTK
jgi:hypothetical protein